MLIERLAQEDPKHEMAVETLKAGERASEVPLRLPKVISLVRVVERTLTPGAEIFGFSMFGV